MTSITDSGADIHSRASHTGFAPAQARLETCHGCRFNLYSAPGGQRLVPFPHSRCLKLQANIPMILGPHEKWLGSRIPEDCPKKGAARGA